MSVQIIHNQCHTNTTKLRYGKDGCRFYIEEQNKLKQWQRVGEVNLCHASISINDSGDTVIRDQFQSITVPYHAVQTRRLFCDGKLVGGVSADRFIRQWRDECDCSCACNEEPEPTPPQQICVDVCIVGGTPCENGAYIPEFVADENTIGIEIQPLQYCPNGSPLKNGEQTGYLLCTATKEIPLLATTAPLLFGSRDNVNMQPLTGWSVKANQGGSILVTVYKKC